MDRVLVDAMEWADGPEFAAMLAQSRADGDRFEAMMATAAPLIGSPKQIAWADEVRFHLIDRWERRAAQQRSGMALLGGFDLAAFDAGIAEKRARLLSEARAGWWIDRRNDDGTLR